MTQFPLVVWTKKAGGFAKFKLAQAEEAIDIWRAPTLEKKLGVAPIPLRVPGVDRVCNPSIVRSGSGWLVAARRLNYRMEANGAYTVKGGIKNLSSETYLVLHSGSNGSNVSRTGLREKTLVSSGSEIAYWACGNRKNDIVLIVQCCVTMRERKVVEKRIFAEHQ